MPNESSSCQAANNVAWCQNKHYTKSKKQKKTVLQSKTEQASTTCDLFEPPAIALVTEEDTCHDDIRMHKAINVMQEALTAGSGIQLLSVRLRPRYNTSLQVDNESLDADQKTEVLAYRNRVKIFCDSIRRIIVDYNENNVVSDKNSPCRIVMNLNEMPNDLDIALECQLDGIHVKELQRDLIPEIRRLWRTRELKGGRTERNPIIGTSSHSIESAVSTLSEHGVDYIFVGTCFTTKSHPEKKLEDLEGPALPGKVQRTLQELGYPTLCFAIGGIDETNCVVPIRFGCDGVAVIRSIMQSETPRNTARFMTERVHRAWALR